MPRKYFFLFLTILALSNSGCATVARKSFIPATALSPGAYHIVSSGQTLWRIAKTYNVEVEELMRVNAITDPGQLSVGQRLLIPQSEAAFSRAPKEVTVTGDAENIVGPKHFSSHWRTITIHHSGTLEGNAVSFDRNHRQRGMGGLFYHFVIGNGAGSGDGQIEVGWRWKKQIQVNRPKDIQICLVGDFNRQRISNSQFNSLIKLITVLSRQYGISVKNIRKHKSIRGKHTACPGNTFPFDQIIAQLRQIRA